HARECTEPEPAVGKLAHGGERGIVGAERVDVDEERGALDVELEEINEVRAAGDEACALQQARSARSGIGGRRGAAIAEVDHRFASEVAVPRTDCTAATMPGYAPHRQMLPLIASRSSSSPAPHGSFSMAV